MDKLNWLVVVSKSHHIIWYGKVKGHTPTIQSYIQQLGIDVAIKNNRLLFLVSQNGNRVPLIKLYDLHFLTVWLSNGLKCATRSWFVHSPPFASINCLTASKVKFSLGSIFCYKDSSLEVQHVINTKVGKAAKLLFIYSPLPLSLVQNQIS